MDRMWNDWRATFPKSTTAQDGWIGDPAHQKEKSGHNPDDTSGVVAEYTDSDSDPEVRAIDKDARLNDPRGVTMQQVIDRMLKTPPDLARLGYIIYKTTIWSASSGWVPRHYDGEAHDLHGHFSGNAANDNNDAPWTSITSFASGGSMATLDTIQKVVDEIEQGNIVPNNALIYWVRGIAEGKNSLASGGTNQGPDINGIPEVLAAITTLAAGGVTQEALNLAVKTALLDPEVIAALKQTVTVTVNVVQQ